MNTATARVQINSLSVVKRECVKAAVAHQAFLDTHPDPQSVISDTDAFLTAWVNVLVKQGPFSHENTARAEISKLAKQYGKLVDEISVLMAAYCATKHARLADMISEKRQELYMLGALELAMSVEAIDAMLTERHQAECNICTAP